jgi:GAF domain-containing protein
VQATVASVPGFDHVGVSIMHRNGQVETKAGTGQLVWDLDAVQYELGEGPCVDTLRGEVTVTAPTIRLDQRWPRFVPRAVEAGVRSQLALQLYVEDETLGGLNLYSTQSEEIDPTAEHAAGIFATHAALALGRARRESQLAEAIGTRQSIGTAVGLIMGRYQLDRERAFQFLTRASSTSNIKIRDIADEIIKTAEDSFKPPN